MNQSISEFVMRIIRLKKVLERTGLGRSTVYKKMANGTFPVSVSLGGKSRGWVEAEVESWIRSCMDSRYTPAAHSAQDVFRSLGY